MPENATPFLPTIRVKIAMLVLACALPTALGFGALVHHYAQRERALQTEDALQTARALAGALDRELAGAESAALALAGSPSLQRGDFSAFQAQAQSLLRPQFPGFVFTLSDTGGRQLMTTAVPFGQPLPQRGNLDGFQRVLAGGQAVYSNLYFDGAQPHTQPRFDIEVPVWRADKVAYTLSVGIAPERISQLLIEQRLEPELIGTILDTSGTVVTRSRDAAKYVGRPAVPALLRGIGESSEGKLETRSLEGVPVYATFSRALHSGWTVVIGIPVSSLRNELLGAVSLISLAVAALLLAGFALAWGMGGRISRSIIALSLPARALADGVPSQLPVPTFREAREVTTALTIKRLEMLLRDKEEYFRVLYESSRDAHLMTTLQAGFVDANQAAARLFGCRDIAEFLTLSAALASPEFQPDGSRSDEKAQAMMRIALDTGGHRFEWLHQRRDGSVFHADVLLNSIDIGGKGILKATIRDISERKRIDNALRESKQLLKSIVEHMPAMIFLKRADDLRFEMLNRHGEIILGCQRGDMLGKNDHDLFPPAQADLLGGAERRILLSDAVVETEQELFPAGGGAPRFLTTRKVALRNEAGQATHLLGIALDISERRHAEHNLRATTSRLEQGERFLRTITDNLPGMVAYWDAGLRCRFANRPFAALMGRMPDDIVGMTVHDVLGPDMMALNGPHIEAVLAGQPQYFERELRLAGQARHAWYNYLPDLDDAGRVRGFYVLISDVTPLKLAELRLHDLNEELVRARDKAEAASDAKSAFLANMSHEIRTPMNAIIGLARLLEEATLERRERSYVANIKLATQSLLGVLNDVLDFSKIEAGRLALEQAPFKLDAILNSISVLIAGNAWSKGVEPIFIVAPALPLTLVGDALRLQQILFNLVGNAVKFTEHGEVQLEIGLLEQDDDSVTLEFAVRDTGIGIAPAQQETIFDAFSQGDSSTSRRYGGSGLGLAICRRLVDLMGGAIRVRSALGQGAEFSFRCRFGRRAPEAGQAATLQPPTVPALTGLEILIVDDNASVRRMLADSCAALGWRSSCADSGAAALALLQQYGPTARLPDLLLLDGAMPGMDGISMLVQARQVPGLALPPVVMMVPDHAGENLALLADDLQLAAILSKPATPTLLLAAVTVALAGGAPAADAASTPLAGRLAGMRLLLVEDNQINQEVAQYVLRHAGAVIDVADNGQIAVDMLKPVAQADAPRYDAVLMDIQMPVMNGYEATLAIRAMGLLDLPIIAMTANAMADDRRHAIEVGMTAHVPKPIDVDELIATLSRATGIELATAPPLSSSTPETRPQAPALPTPTPQSQAWPNQLAGIDLAGCRERFGGDYAAFAALLLRFEASQGGAVDEARHALRAGRHDDVARILHRLRGVTANLGAVAIAKLCAVAETALQRGVAAPVEVALDALGAGMQILSGTLRTLPAPAEASVGADIGATCDPQVALAELLALLQNNNMAALTCFQALRPALEQEAEATQLLADAIETLDFTLAETLVKEFLDRKDSA